MLGILVLKQNILAEFESGLITHMIIEHVIFFFLGAEMNTLAVQIPHQLDVGNGIRDKEAIKCT